MEFSISNIFNVVKEVVINPKDFWTNQKDSNGSAMLLTGYYFPLLLVVALAVFLGEFFSSSHFYVWFAVFKALREIVLFILQYFIAVFFTVELMRTFGSEKNRQVAQKLVVFSLTPILLVSFITGLFQFLYVIDILGIYGFYIFWVGAKELTSFPNEKQNSYILITLLVNFFIFSFLSVFLSKLMEAFF